MTKICKKCGYAKPSDYNNFDKGGNKDGLKSWCKPCSKKANNERYERKKSQIITQIKTWQSKNPEKVKKYKKHFYEKTK